MNDTKNEIKRNSAATLPPWIWVVSFICGFLREWQSMSFYRKQYVKLQFTSSSYWPIIELIHTHTLSVSHNLPARGKIITKRNKEDVKEWQQHHRQQVNYTVIIWLHNTFWYTQNVKGYVCAKEEIALVFIANIKHRDQWAFNNASIALWIVLIIKAKTNKKRKFYTSLVVFKIRSTEK